MKKKITAVALVVAILALALIGGTLAYFTDTKNVTNTFTVGNVAITLTETNWVQPATVQPGIPYAKNPVVTNTGANDAWIRVNVTVSDADAFKTACANHSITDLSTIFAGHDETKWTLAATTEDKSADTLTYSYYYKTKLVAADPDVATDPLFTSVTIPSSFTSAEMAALGDNFTITVTADAIQADSFANVAAAFAAFDDQSK